MTFTTPAKWLTAFKLNAHLPPYLRQSWSMITDWACGVRILLLHWKDTDQSGVSVSVMTTMWNRCPNIWNKWNIGNYWRTMGQFPPELLFAAIVHGGRSRCFFGLLSTFGLNHLPGHDYRVIVSHIGCLLLGYMSLIICVLEENENACITAIKVTVWQKWYLLVVLHYKLHTGQLTLYPVTTQRQSRWLEGVLSEGGMIN
jgi:hypothetical protein